MEHKAGYLLFCKFTLHVSGVNMSYRFADSKLSANLYDMYHCCVYSARLLMMDRETVRNM